MGAGQGKAGRMLHARRAAAPSGKDARGVARHAVGGVVQRAVVGRPGLVEIGQVARDAVGGRVRVIPGFLVLVALGAVIDGMGSHQREPGMRPPLLGQEFRAPFLGGMAGLAIGPEFSLMDVAMAISAGGAHRIELQILVAIHAGDGGMAAREGKARLAMIEIEEALGRLPSLLAMAVAALHGNVAVRIGLALGGLGMPGQEK